MDAVKCPACGMESPEELGYCDFCKEPFRKKKPEPAPPPSKQPAVPVPPEVFAKLMQAKAAAEPKAAGEEAGIPAEFAHLDAGERIEGIPPGLRAAAWAFLAFVMLAGLGLAGTLISKGKRAKPAPPPVSEEGTQF
ncbi:MAG: hypothetical protein HYZ75_13585 [Elusimicrobia bacterium]|nr:hypothetical protein [Elusimicrobiota bacterium]